MGKRNKQKYSINTDSLPYQQIGTNNDLLTLPNFLNSMDHKELMHVYKYVGNGYDESFIVGKIRFQSLSLLEFVSKDNDPNTMVLFTDLRFLTLFEKAITTDKIFRVEDKHKMCKIIYDYLNRSDINKSKEVLDIFKHIVKVSYPNEVGRLSQIVSFDTAVNLVMFRYSADKEIENVSRVNNYIIDQNCNMMTVQTIANIYQILFDRLTPIFESIMMVDVAIKPNYNESNITNFNNITQVVLALLETSTDRVIFDVLRNYANDWAMIMNKPSVRFSIRELNSTPDNGFPRICLAAQILQTNYGIIIP